MLDIERITKQALREVFEGSYSDYPEGFKNVTERVFNEAVDSGFGNAEGTLDGLLISKVKTQNSVFAGMKAQGLTMKLEQIKRAEKCKSAGEYIRKAMPTANAFQKNYLQAEYNTLKRSMQSSRQYARALRDTDLYPFIRYMPSRAENPRESHKVYYNVTRPATDAFWHAHLPPLAWNCDCWWKTVKTGETPVPNNLPKIPEGLDNNPAVSGQPFANSHPYFSSLSDKAKETVLKRTAAGISQRSVEDMTLFKANVKTNGCHFSFGNAGEVVDEYKDVNHTATDYLTGKGRFVELLARVEQDGIKSIDANVNGVAAEFKSYSSRNAIQKQMKKANSQFRGLSIKDGDVYLHNSATMDLHEVWRGINGRIKDTETIGHVFVIIDQKQMYIYTKKGMTEIIP